MPNLGNGGAVTTPAGVSEDTPCRRFTGVRFISRYCFRYGIYAGANLPFARSATISLWRV